MVRNIAKRPNGSAKSAKITILQVCFLDTNKVRTVFDQQGKQFVSSVLQRSYVPRQTAELMDLLAQRGLRAVSGWIT